MMNVSVLIIRGFSVYLTLSVHFHKDSCCICFTALSFRRKGLILALWQSSWTHLPAPHTHIHPPKSPFKVRRQLCQTSFQFSGKALTPWCSDVLSLFLYFINKKKKKAETLAQWESCLILPVDLYKQDLSIPSSPKYDRGFCFSFLERSVFCTTPWRGHFTV